MLRGKAQGTFDSVGEKEGNFSTGQTISSDRKDGRTHKHGYRVGRHGGVSVWKLSSEYICFLSDKRWQGH